MKLTLKRIAKRPTYTIGRLYIDGKYFCDTLEDLDRGASATWRFTKALNGTGYWTSPEGKVVSKVNSETAIPTGTYMITMNLVSPKYSNFSKYPWAKLWKGKLPRLLNVPGFDGILIHVGNTAKDSSGCILVGKNTIVGKVTDSTNTFNKLMLVLTKQTSIQLTIQ